MANRNIVSALRVAQLDTTELDDNVMQLLSNQLQSCIKHNILNYDFMYLEPHLRTAMYGLLLYNTLWKNKQTIGQKLLGLRYGDHKTLGVASATKLLLLQACLLLQYWLRSTKHVGLAKRFKLQHIDTVYKFCSNLHGILSLLNFMLFLRQGHFHLMLLRAAGLRTVYVDPNPPMRNITFQLMSRDLLWHGFAETGVFFLSLINISKIKRWCSAFIFKPSETDGQETNYECALCKALPVMPYVGACKLHPFCYYCVSSALNVDVNVKCPSCNKTIQTIQPLEAQKQIVNII